MTTSLELLTEEIEYPDSDGQPMAEGDIQCDYLIYARQALRIHFQSRPDVYVAGNLFIYYEQGNPKAVVAPDTFVVFGVASSKRHSYKVWREAGKTPDFALEITSKSTKKEDQVTKPTLYAALGVQEYFQFDPTGDYLHPQLQGRRLVNGVYQSMAATVVSGMLSIRSQVLGLELRLQDGDLRFYDPLTGQVLLAHEEERQARLQAEQDRLQAERDRFQAEQDRFQAEQDRFQAEQDRFRAEQAQAQAEQDRFQAEQDRFRAEQAQAQAEQDRFWAEQAQAQAEQDRFQAEQARLQAEQRSQQLAEKLRQLNIDPDAP